jgi:DNA-binding transcriptional regulator YhcF (GntR family)
MQSLISIDESTGTAKYKQIVQGILNGIDDGRLKIGDQTPSINVLTQEFGLSQDTVLAAYKELKHRGFIASSVGKGFFVAKTDVNERHNIFVLFDKLTSYKEELYEAMKSSVGSRAALDIYFHHGNQKAFDTLIRNALGKYTAFVVVPIIGAASDRVLSEIPKKKLFIIDQGIARYGKKYRSVCQNFESDVYKALEEASLDIAKYAKLFFVHRDQRQQFRELERGFIRFCRENQFDYQLLSDLKDHKLQPGEFYLLVDDKDLVRAIKHCRSERLKVGKEIGIISYNDSPFKEVIGEGISTISTDFTHMGKSVMAMIFSNETRHLENPTKLIHRHSF